MSGMSQQDMMTLWQQAQAPGASGGGFQPQQYAQAPGASGGGFQTQQAPGAGGGGMGIQPVPMMQPDPAYGQQPQFTMQGAQPRVNGVRSNGLLSPGTMRMDPSYRGQQGQMPAITSRPAPIGRIRGQ